MGLFARRRPKAGTPLENGAWKAPSRFNFTRDVVEVFAADPLLPALTFVDRDGIIARRTYADVLLEANRWTGLLRSRGLRPGERILVVVGKTPTWHAVLLGALKAGVVAVPCPRTLSGTELAARAEQTGARLVVAGIEYAPKVARMAVTMDVILVEAVDEELKAITSEQPAHNTTATDTAFIVYLRDATGDARIVSLSHASTWTARLHAEHVLDAHPGDIVWCTGGTGRATSIWNGLLGPWSRGAESVIHDGPFDVEQRFELIRRLGVTVLCQDASEYKLMVESDSSEGHRLGRLRHAVSVREPLDEELISAFQDIFGVTLLEDYGPTGPTPGSTGLPAPARAVAAVDDVHDVQPDDTNGHLALGDEPWPLVAGYVAAPDRAGNGNDLPAEGRERAWALHPDSSGRFATAPTVEAHTSTIGGRPVREEPSREEQEPVTAVGLTLPITARGAVPEETVQVQPGPLEEVDERPSRREVARHRRDERRARKQEIRARKDEERRLEKEQKATAAAEKASEAERRRKEEEQRRHEEQSAAAERKQRKAEERQQVLAAKLAERAEEAQRKEQKRQQSKDEKRGRNEDRGGAQAPEANGSDSGNGLGDVRPDVELVSRLSAYGRRIPEGDRPD